MIKIVSIKSDLPYDIYCGRSNKHYNLIESKWHNPFVIGKDGDRKEVIQKYEEYIRAKPELLAQLPELKDKTLACWCDVSKEACHCQVLGKLLEELYPCTDIARIKDLQVVDTELVKEPGAQIVDDFIGSSLLRYNKEQVYLLYDEETTGLNLLYTKPWQISYCLFTIDKIISTHNYYIWWENLQMSEQAATITHFDYNHYKFHAKPLEAILPLFERYYLDNSIIKVGHNIIPYDSNIWSVARKSLNLKPTFEPNLHSIDTLALARAYRLGIKPHKFNLNGDNYDFLAWQYRMISWHTKKMKTSLNSLAKEFDILTDESRLHDASYDILINRQIFLQFLWKMEI